MTTDAIVEEIEIKAPAARIFEAITNPEERLQWWGAKGKFEIISVESDLRPGGRWVMRGVGMDERPLTVAGEYREITRPHLLEFTWLPDWQDDGVATVVRWELKENNGVTTVRLTHSGFTTDASRATYRGWPIVLGGLQAFVERQN